MRIAIVAPLVTAIREPQLGGSQAFLSDLATGLTARNHEVHVYAASGSSIPGVTVRDTGVDPQSLAGVLYHADGRAVRGTSEAQAAFARVYASVNEGAYDVVHNHAFDPPAVRLATALSTPVVHTLHLPPDRHMADAFADARRSTNPPTVAGVSTSQAAAWQALTRIDTVLPDGVPVDRIPCSVQAGEGVVFAGRFSPEKGADDAIAIAQRAGVAIDLYGEPYDPDYARSRVESHRGEPGVQIHSGLTRPELWQVMARALAILCPVKWEEPFGLVAAEAQATGTPVIAYRRGALEEVVLDGQTGFLVAPDDVDAAAGAIAKVGGLNREACRRHAEAHLNLEASLIAHERLYERVARPAATSHA